MENKTKKLCISSVFIALGVILGQFSIPIGPAKIFFMQHFLNVVGAMLLGPGYTLANAFLISLLRNLLGVGSLLAFPGSMVGAWLGAKAYQKIQKPYGAALGEVVGTGILGSLLSCPIAGLLMGKKVGALFFVLPFLLSAITGAVLGLLFEKAKGVDFLEQILKREGGL